MDWENHLEKNLIQKIRKNSKNQSEIAAREQKTTSEKVNFCSNTVFSLYFKFRAKKFHAAKPLAFSLLFLFRRDQNHYSNLTLKIMKMCEQIFKKRQRPNKIQILRIVKKTKRRPIIAPAIAVRINQSSQNISQIAPHKKQDRKSEFSFERRFLTLF